MYQAPRFEEAQQLDRESPRSYFAVATGIWASSPGHPHGADRAPQRPLGARSAQRRRRRSRLPRETGARPLIREMRAGTRKQERLELAVPAGSPVCAAATAYFTASPSAGRISGGPASASMLAISAAAI